MARTDEPQEMSYVRVDAGHQIPDSEERLDGGSHAPSIMLSNGNAAERRN